MAERSATDVATCPGCGFPVSEMERLTGRCAKDGRPLDESRVVFEIHFPEES